LFEGIVFDISSKVDGRRNIVAENFNQDDFSFTTCRKEPLLLTETLVYQWFEYNTNGLGKDFEFSDFTPQTHFGGFQN
jgi:hypothetical protein